MTINNQTIQTITSRGVRGWVWVGFGQTQNQTKWGTTV